MTQTNNHAGNAANRKMTRMALVNWGPYEQPDIIELSDFTIFTGMNGTGKTMSMDAVAFALYGIKDFNAAAKNDGETRMNRRNLIKIIHGSTKSADCPYLRPDAVISWCIIEFYDSKREKYFLCGQVSESRDLSSCKTWRFVIDDCRIEDFKFRSDDGTEIYSRGECTCKGIPVRLDTFQEKGNGLKQIAKAMGIPGNFSKVAGVIKKTMALRPDADINRFIADSILDEKEGSNEILSSLRAMQNNYTEATAELERVEKERDVLKKANEAADEYLSANRKLIMSRIKNAYRKVSDADTGISEKKKEMSERESDLKKIKLETAALEKMQETAHSEMMQIYNASGLAAVDAINASRENALKQLERDERDLVSKETDVMRFKQGAKDALRVFGKDPEAAEIIKLLDSASPENLRRAFGLLEAFKNKRVEILRRRQYDAEKDRDELYEQIRSANDELRALSSDIPVYPKIYADAKRRLEDHFVRNGKSVPVKFAVELIRGIKDEKWQTAIETLLGKRRFSIIVPAEYEDEAYAFIKSEKIYGIEIVMTSILKDEDVKEGTAAAIIDIVNNDAKKYFNRIIGNIWLADSEQQVKEFAKEKKASITREGTRSSGYSRSVSRPEKILYIGENAVRIQTAAVKQRIRNLNSKHAESLKYIKEFGEKSHSLDGLYFEYDRYDFEASLKLDNTRDKIASIKKEIENFKKETADIRAEYSRKEEEYNAVRRQVLEKVGMSGAVNNKIEEINGKISNLEQIRKDAKANYDALCEKYPDYEFEVVEEIAKAAKAGKFPEGSSDKAVSDNTLDADQKKTEMERCQEECCRMRGEKNINLLVGPDRIPVFRKMFADLDNVRFEECREAVRTQRDRLRHSLIQNFIARLSEQIDNANKEKNRKNRILSKMRFGQQRYQFKIEPCRDGAMKLFYRIKEELDGAMSPEALTAMLDIDTGLNNTVLEFLDVILKDIDSTKYTDYRNYLKCDMRIEEDNNMSYDLSSKAGESSNGEKQTPYLIILAVSLCTLYPDSSDVAKICLMDEAFAAWSDDRIGQMISYFKENGFQVIFAAPDSMYNSVSKYMDTVVTCVKSSDSPYAFYCDGTVLR